MSRDPQGPCEWQEAVNSAEFLRLIHDCVLYGLLATDMKIKVERCDEILRRGKALGFIPAGIDELMKKYAGAA